MKDKEKTAPEVPVHEQLICSKCNNKKFSMKKPNYCSLCGYKISYQNILNN